MIGYVYKTSYFILDTLDTWTLVFFKNRNHKNKNENDFIDLYKEFCEFSRRPGVQVSISVEASIILSKSF